MADPFSGARRIVVKVGSSLVTNEGRGIEAGAVGDWCRQMAELVRSGRELVMVSSGAIAEGMKRLGWPARPRGVHELQAAAAVGQMGLAQIYESALRAHGIGSAQVLLTHADLADRERYLNARSTLVTLLGLGVVPVINENDTVVNDEIKFGDNDTLGALVTNLLDADVLVILTDQQGLFSADPRRDPAARLVESGHAGDPAFERMAGGAGSSLGRGGMLTKVLAAKRAARCGASTVIASGRERDVLLRCAVVVDDGAATNLRHGGKSLLPIGVVTVEGDFHRGDVIAVRRASGEEIGRGLSNYGSAEARLIARKPSSEIGRLLGFAGEPELIHRDNLVLA